MNLATRLDRTGQVLEQTRISSYIPNSHPPRAASYARLSLVPLRKAIAAFANTNAGTIFLGIDNHARVVGINCGTPNEKDLELQRIRNITAQMITPAIPVVVDFISYQEKTVVRIFIPRGDQPLYFLDRQIYVRDQTASMVASPAHVEEILKKFYR